MRLLVLGGTRFVGRHLVEAALAARHEVTLFNRGKTGAELFPAARRLVGERGGDHAALAQGEWDAAIDVSGYRPAEVRGAAKRLRGRAGVYVFVSTVSVYARFEEGGDETAATCAPADDGAQDTAETYGPLKRACELVLEREWDGPWTSARAGLVAGPHDPTDRFTYWPARSASGGAVLAPGSPDHLAQFIDARDLAEWLLRAAEGKARGPHNVIGPALRFEALLKDCAAAAGAAPELRWADDAFLTFHGLRPYQDLPLWVPGPLRPFDARRAAATGLLWRPAAETAADVLRWHRERGSPPLRAGLAPDQERRLLAELSRAA